MEIPSHSYGVSLAIWDHTCHPTQVNTSQPCRPVLDLPTLEEWKAELT